MNGDKELEEHPATLDSLSAYSLVTVTKSDKKITVYQGAKEMASFDTVGTFDTSSILFSNKPVMINGSGMLDYKLCMFAMYKKAATPEDLAALVAHVDTRRVAMHDSYVAVWAENAAAKKNDVCPLKDQSVCLKSCDVVKNWSNTMDVMQSTTPECKTQINAYCIANSATDPFCECWGTPGKKECDIVKSFFANDLAPKAACPTCATPGPATGGPADLKKYYSDAMTSSGGGTMNTDPGFSLAKVNDVYGVSGK
jgi:hypothetical protein